MRIVKFAGDYRFLSNFYPIEGGMLYKGIIYPTSEHAYQASKVERYNEKLQIAELPTAKKAKIAGRHVDCVSNWEQIKVAVMLDILRAKFSNPHTTLVNKLLLTGDLALLEMNTWHDNLWGVCSCANCLDEVKHNLLGKLLVQVRTERFIEHYHDQSRALHKSTS